MTTKYRIDFSEVSEHLDFLFTDTRGYVVVGFLNRRNRKMVEQSYRWPSEKSDLIQAINDREDVDVFVCPYPMESSQRAKGNTTALRMLHTDMDYDVPSHVRDTLRRWGFRIVASGTPGHVQAFARLSRPVTPAEHRALEIGLRDWSARYGKTEKIADNDFMRVPGKVNHKNGADVEIITRGRWSVKVDKLVQALRISLDDRDREIENNTDVRQVPIPDDLPDDVAALVAERSDGVGDRSERSYNAVMTVAEAGFNREQIHAILANYDPGVDKYGLRWPDQIDDILAKVRTVVQYEPDPNFWSRRKRLTHIFEYAEATEANPWAVLGVVMVRMLHQVPPHVLMPGVNGTEAGTRCLNMYVALVGASGAGKKTATDAATLAFDVGETYPSMNLGSGEGISKAFRRPATKDDGRVRGGQVVKTTKVIFDVAEVSTWNALAGRANQGSTLVGEVLKGFSGESLGFSNADDAKTNPVPANSYRMCIIIGAQPQMCGPLLGNVASGLPQRFLWLPATEQPHHEFDAMPTPPAPRVWPSPDFGQGDDKGREKGGGEGIVFARSVERARFYERRELREDPMESQAIVVKMRVAVALALMEGRTNVTDDDWDLASVVMMVSRSTRQSVMDELRRVNVEQARSRGRMTAHQKHAETTTTVKLESRVVDAVAGSIVALLQNTETGQMSASEIRRKTNRNRRAYVNDALESLVESGQVKMRDHTYRGQVGKLVLLKN